MEKLVGVLIVAAAFLVILVSLIISTIDAFRRGLYGLFRRGNSNE